MKKSSKKPKNKTTKSLSKKAPQSRGYEAHYLAVILIAFLLLEGFLFTSTQSRDWQKGIQVLDMSSAVAQTTSDLRVVMQPIVDAVEGVNEFYQIAATEMMHVLDISGQNPLEEVALVTEGVYDFYQSASQELTYLLDVSERSSWPARVAGVSVSH